MTTQQSAGTSYLFYSPQLDGVNVGAQTVPPIHAGMNNNSPQLGSAAPNAGVLPNEFNLTPQFGPFLGSGHPQPHTSHMPGVRPGQSPSPGFFPAQPNVHPQVITRDSSRAPDVDVSFLNSPLPHGIPDQNHHFYQSMMYTSPAYASLGVPAYGTNYNFSPIFFGVQPGAEERTRISARPKSFDPLPESGWNRGDPTRGAPHGHAHAHPHAHAQDLYSSHRTLSQHYDGQHSHSQHSRVAHFPPMSAGANIGGSHGPANNGHYISPELIGNSGGKSVILDDLRSVHTGVPHPRSHSLQDIVSEGLVADLATDQNGSRFIQTKLEEATDGEKQAVFEQILPETLRLCTDVFGNYCIQKFFEYGTPEQKLELSRKIKHRVLPLSLQMYGCRVVQKILESVDSETQKALISELDGHVLECVKDQNANHVIQKCIEQVSNSENIDFIIKAFYGRVYDLSTHPYGCRVIQRMLEHCLPELKNPVLDELMQFAEQLAKDQYGNYVLQHVLQHSVTECKDKIVNIVASYILPFSKHKFASNVVERCFVSTDSRQKDVLLNAVVGTAENSPLVSMVRDQYGNYVIQKMLETLNVPQRNKLIRKIAEYVPNIRKIAFGKHIVAKIEKLTGKSI